MAQQNPGRSAGSRDLGPMPWVKIALAACSLTLAAPAFAAPARPPPPGPSLRTLASTAGIYFGCAFHPGHAGIPSYGSIAATQFNCVTPENAMKWESTEPNQGQFDFAGGDEVVAFAQANKQKVRGHTLVWHSQLPNWVQGLNPTNMGAAMVNHVTRVAQHFAGKVFAWDVVNEPLNEDGSLRSWSISSALGPGYVAEAFKAARAADPNAKLYINDYNIEGRNPKSNAMYELVKGLRAQGVPIDGVGFQAHLTSAGAPRDLQANLQRFVDLGVEVAITELDVRLRVPPTPASLANQAEHYAAVVKACLAVPKCVGITVWGIDDARSWVPATFAGQGAALIFDEEGYAKPAFAGIQAAFTGGSITGSTINPVVPIPPPTAGAISPAAHSSRDVQPPSAPRSLNAPSRTNSSISLSWAASTDNVGVAAYVVYSGASPLATVSGSTTVAKVTGLSPGSAYNLSVRAKDAAGNVSDPSNAIAVVTTATGADGKRDTTPPSAPGLPSASTITSSGLVLSWNPSADDVGVSYYDVYQLAKDGDLLLATSSGTFAWIRELMPATSYTFYVKARDLAGNVSAASRAVTVTTSPAGGGAGPGAPSAGAGTSTSSTSAAASAGPSSGAR